jgi:hypothetical protein
VFSVSGEVSAQGVFGGFAADLAGQVTSTAASAVIGGLVGGPVGAAVGAAGGDVATQTIRALLTAQDGQMARLEEMNRRLEGRMADINDGVQLLLDSPLQDARMQLGQAARARTPERRERDILTARDSLFRAYNQSRSHARRSMVSQALAICFVLDGDPEQASEWLHMAYTEAVESTRVEYQRVHDLLRSQAPAAPPSTGLGADNRPFVNEFYRRGGENLLPQLDATLNLAEDAVKLRRSLIQLGVDEESLVKVRVRAGRVVADVKDTVKWAPYDLTWTEITRSTRGEPDHLTISWRDGWQSMGRRMNWTGAALEAGYTPGPRRPGPRVFEPSAEQWDAFWQWMIAFRAPVLAIQPTTEVPTRRQEWTLHIEGGAVNHNVRGSGDEPVVVAVYLAAEGLLCAATDRSDVPT